MSRPSTTLLAAILLATGCMPRGGGGGGGGGDDDDDAGGSEEATICERWNRDQGFLSEGSWSGSVQGCDPGDISEEGRDNALRQLNLMRFLADLTEVDTDPERDRKAQAAALIFTAEGSLSHTPDTSWACWSADGAEAAGASNISSAPGVYSVMGYMIDRGNESTLGHRRWLLSNRLGPVGLGSTAEGPSAMWVLGGAPVDTAEWTAWPPPGVFPMGAYADFWSSLDLEGWSLQSDSIDLSDASITINDDDGEDLSVDLRLLAPDYGAMNAISIVPRGWTARAGSTYSVGVVATGAEFDYDVSVVDCSQYGDGTD